jgi:hypothetical protein
MVDGQVRYVTALEATDTAGGWRDNKTPGGVLIDVPSRASLEGLLVQLRRPRSAVSTECPPGAPEFRRARTPVYPESSRVGTGSTPFFSQFAVSASSSGLGVPSLSADGYGTDNSDHAEMGDER